MKKGSVAAKSWAISALMCSKWRGRGAIQRGGSALSFIIRLILKKAFTGAHLTAANGASPSIFMTLKAGTYFSS
jgi:hypothetical protein